MTSNMPKTQRSAYAKFRYGVAPLRIETGRYKRLQINEHTCFHCVNEVESEEHVLLSCPVYSDLREQLFECVCRIHAGCIGLDVCDKLSVILGSDDEIVIKKSATICCEMLRRRRSLLYK
jgi:hypothetical protein